MKRLLSILACAFVISSCDSSSGPGNTTRSASMYFPYQIGDTMLFQTKGVLEGHIPFIDTFVQKVVSTRVIDGKTYQLHVLDGYQSDPYEDSIYYRTEGSKVYFRTLDKGFDSIEYLYFDFTEQWVHRREILPYAFQKDTTFVDLPAGGFSNAVILQGGSYSGQPHYDRYIFAPGVGKLVFDFTGVATERLLRAKVGGRSYP